MKKVLIVVSSLILGSAISFAQSPICNSVMINLDQEDLPLSSIIRAEKMISLGDLDSDNDGGVVIDGSSEINIYSGESINGKNTVHIVPSSTGYVKMEIQACSLVTSFEKIADAIKFQAYPNPVNDVLNLKVSKGDYSIQIVSTKGEIVKSIEINNGMNLNQIDLSLLPKGVYILKFRSKDETDSRPLLKK